MKKYLKYLIILALVLAATAGGFFWTRNSLLKNPEVKSAAVSPTQTPTKPAPSYSRTIGGFMVTEREIVREEGKPVVYFFGMETCPHCLWEKPIAQKVFSQFKDEIVYKERFDSEEDMDVFESYKDVNPDYGVPLIIVGGKYVRVGAGESLGATEEESKKLEEEALTALVCKLTDSQPSSICGPLEEEIKAIE